MKLVKLGLLALFIFSNIFVNEVRAQNENIALTKQDKAVVVDSISNKLMSSYVFPETAKKMSDFIRNNIKKGDYNSINKPDEFANRLTEDLLSISHDKHISVNYNPRRIIAQKTVEDSLNYLNQYINNLKRSNFGFKELKILDGNIGYLDLRSFSDVKYAGKTAVSAMNFLSNSDAIIIDLRMNGGGSPEMIQLISSYLFDEPVHLNNFYWRPTNTNTQTWTLPHVQGTRSPNTPVYVLTSNYTFSAAEEFSYNLKHLKRATLIGETSGGGAHPGGEVTATDKFTIWLPSGRAINPITKTNWEGIGVVPHIEVESSRAMKVAHLKSLELLFNTSKDSIQKRNYKWKMDAISIKLNPVVVPKSILKKYMGTYGPRVISIEENTLYYQRDNGKKYKLIPINNTEFLLNGLTTFRIKFISEKGKTVALVGNYINGQTDENLKSKK